MMSASRKRPVLSIAYHKHRTMQASRVRNARISVFPIINAAVCNHLSIACRDCSDVRETPGSYPGKARRHGETAGRGGPDSAVAGGQGQTGAKYCDERVLQVKGQVVRILSRWQERKNSGVTPV